jgi:DNA-directed RNA polymerase specialized sigma24 family protein
MELSLTASIETLNRHLRARKPTTFLAAIARNVCLDPTLRLQRRRREMGIDYLYTTNEQEVATAGSQGWELNGVECYVVTNTVMLRNLLRTP